MISHEELFAQSGLRHGSGAVCCGCPDCRCFKCHCRKYHNERS
jgi:hypothetical protein